MYRELDDNELIYMIQDNDDYVEIMLEKYKPLIVKICKKYQKMGKEIGYELDDLIQVANIGLLEAIHSYKDDKNSLFFTFLTRCIDNKLKTELRNQQTNKKVTLNKAISYDEIIPGTTKTFLETIPDKSLLNPFEYLLIDQEEIEYTKFLNSLPFEVAVIYELKNTGFTLDEISMFLEIDKKTISRLLSTVKKRVTV